MPELTEKQKERESRHANKLSLNKLETMMFDSVVTTCDGCRVEPDGSCSHGYRSPLLVLGII